MRMPQRSTPTARQRRLGAELRKLRERAGLSATEAGALLGIERTKVSNIETGRSGVSPERVRTMACAYEAGDTGLVGALADMTADRVRQWWEEYRDLLPSGMLDIADLEHQAVQLHVSNAMHVPGLLQTREYARAVFEQVVPALSPPQVEHRLSFRIKRQGVLYRQEPVRYTAFIHEAALRMLFGGESSMRGQLRHLLDASDQDNLDLRVVTFTAGAYPGAGQSIDFTSGAVPQLDTVQLDTSHGPELLDASAQLDKYRTIFSRMDLVALAPKDSRDFIRDLVKANF